jgi:hypothetical protein
MTLPRVTFFQFCETKNWQIIQKIRKFALGKKKSKIKISG